MAIYRGPGGAGDATNDATSQAIIAVEAAEAAQASQVAAAASQVAANNSAEAAAVSETNAAAYAASINPADLVHISGTETITGSKTFNTNPTLSSGTANGVAYLNGSKVLTTGNALTFDGTNFSTTGRVTSGSYLTVQKSGTSIAYIGSGADIITGGSTGDFALTTPTALGNMVFGIANNEGMRLTGTGLGIGTSSPGERLSVSTTTGITAKFINSVSYGSLISLSSTAIGGKEWQLHSTANGDGTTGGGYFNIVNSTDASVPFRLSASGNLGLGVTPSAWAAAVKAIEVSNGGVYGFAGSTGTWSTNGYYNGANWIYKTSSYAAQYSQSLGQHQWFNAPSGTAGNAISFTQAMTLDASGNLLVGTTTTRNKITIAGTTTASPTLGTASGTAYFCGGDTAYGLMFGTAGTGNSWIQVQRVDGTATPYDLVLQPSGGNVGIGTNSPSIAPGAKLVLQTATGSNGQLAIDNVSYAAGQIIGIDFTVAGGSKQAFTRAIVENGTTAATALTFGTATGGNNAAERMRIDSSGNVGIGTSSPNSGANAGKLSVQSSQDFGISVYRDSLNPAQIAFLDQNNSCAVGTNGVGSMVFYNNSRTTERMRIDSSGNVLVGTTSTSTPSSGIALVSAIAEIKLGHPDGTSSGYSYCVFGYNGNVIGSVAQNGTTAVAYNTSSDYRLKENIQPMQNALDVVAQLNPVTYTWKADGSDGQGFIAHELQAVVPDCVTGEKDAVDEDGNPVYQGIDTSFLVATLTKAIQELKTEVDSLKAQLENK